MNITIDRKSWHYRWFNYLGTKLSVNGYWEDPRSVCSYFWEFVFVHIVVLIIGVLFIIGFCICVMATVGLPVLYWSWLMNGSMNAGGLAIVITILDLVFAIAIFKEFLYQSDWDFRYKVEKLKSKNKSASFLTIIMKSVVAFKNKVCPMIEYIGDK